MLTAGLTGGALWPRGAVPTLLSHGPRHKQEGVPRRDHISCDERNTQEHQGQRNAFRACGRVGRRRALGAFLWGVFDDIVKCEPFFGGRGEQLGDVDRRDRQWVCGELQIDHALGGPPELSRGFGGLNKEHFGGLGAPFWRRPVADDSPFPLGEEQTLP